MPPPHRCHSTDLRLNVARIMNGQGRITAACRLPPKLRRALANQPPRRVRWSEDQEARGVINNVPPHRDPPWRAQRPAMTTTTATRIRPNTTEGVVRAQPPASSASGWGTRFRAWPGPAEDAAAGCRVGLGATVRGGRRAKSRAEGGRRFIRIAGPTASGCGGGCLVRGSTTL